MRGRWPGLAGAAGADDGEGLGGAAVPGDPLQDLLGIRAPPHPRGRGVAPGDQGPS